jgi:hypothetical protein
MALGTNDVIHISKWVADGHQRQIDNSHNSP